MLAYEAGEQHAKTVIVVETRPRVCFYVQLKPLRQGSKIADNRVCAIEMSHRFNDEVTLALLQRRWTLGRKR